MCIIYIILILTGIITVKAAKRQINNVSVNIFVMKYFISHD